MLLRNIFSNQVPWPAGRFSLHGARHFHDGAFGPIAEKLDASAAEHARELDPRNDVGKGH